MSWYDPDDALLIAEELARETALQYAEDEGIAKFERLAREEQARDRTPFIETAREYWTSVAGRTRWELDQIERSGQEGRTLTFDQATHCWDNEGATLILPSAMDEDRVRTMVEQATFHVQCTKDELNAAYEAVTRALAPEATLLIQETYPGADVEVSYELWGVNALRYYGDDAEQLYDRGIPSAEVLEEAITRLDAGKIAVDAIVDAQISARQATTEPVSLETERTTVAETQPTVHATKLTRLQQPSRGHSATVPSTEVPPLVLETQVRGYELD